MATELPVKHLQRLIALADNDNGPAAIISAHLVRDWLQSLNGEDPVAILGAVLDALGMGASSVLGDELYARIVRVRGNDEDEDDGGDCEDEDAA